VLLDDVNVRFTLTNADGAVVIAIDPTPPKSSSSSPSSSSSSPPPSSSAAKSAAAKTPSPSAGPSRHNGAAPQGSSPPRSNNNNSSHPRQPWREKPTPPQIPPSTLSPEELAAQRLARKLEKKHAREQIRARAPARQQQNREAQRKGHLRAAVAHLGESVAAVGDVTGVGSVGTATAAASALGVGSEEGGAVLHRATREKPFFAAREPRVRADPLISLEAFATWVVSEDNDLLVLNKPGDFVCHPSKNGPLSSIVGAARLHTGLTTVHLVARLDRETSGVRRAGCILALV
jgi:hypothetical protein